LPSLSFFQVSQFSPASTQEKPVALEVGLLIDGSGGEPIKDAVVVHGKRITAVGMKGKADIPKDAKFIRLPKNTATPA
jgi:imidazolonepropionase-like amidohydrolase